MAPCSSTRTAWSDRSSAEEVDAAHVHVAVGVAGVDGRRAIERGEVRPDIDTEAALDVIYSPLWSRLLIGHRPMNNRLVDQVLDVVWPGLTSGGPGATER